MAEKVTFDGPNRLIIINYGEDVIDAKVDLYSAWKRWFTASPSGDVSANSAYLEAFSTTGGDDIGEGQTISPYYFLENGWRVKPYEDDHFLTINGNLYVREGGSPVVGTDGSYSVVAKLVVSPQSITTVVETSASGLTDEESYKLFSLPDRGEYADEVWDELLSEHTSAGTAGQIINQIKKLVNLIPSTV